MTEEEAPSVLGRVVVTEQEAKTEAREAEHEASETSAWQHDEADAPEVDEAGEQYDEAEAFDEGEANGDTKYQPGDDEGYEARDQVAAEAKAKMGGAVCVSERASFEC